MLFGYGFGLGKDFLLHGKIRRAVPYLVKPVNYWRTAEYRAVLREAAFAKGDRVLDVASPKLLSIYLAEQIGAAVTATHIGGYFVEKLKDLLPIPPIPTHPLHIQLHAA